jgi:alpha-tubulin suppressor-like RCC1 family protein
MGFKGNDDVLGFPRSQQIQKRPTTIPALKEWRRLPPESTYALVLTYIGSIFNWGSSKQNQLGRRMLEHTNSMVLCLENLAVLKASST